MDGGEGQASRNEEMTNGYRSTEAPLSDAERYSYLCPSTRTDRSCCCQLIWQTLPLVNVQERRGRCSLAMEMLIREFIQSPWVWLGLTEKVFGERLLSLGSEESDPKDGMCVWGELGLFREVFPWMPWSCCPMCFVLKRVLYASSWRLYCSANILSRLFTIPEICSLPRFPNLGNGDNI